MATLKEIAELANVSVGTVDRVIHNRGRVSPETQQKIQQIIRSVNYKPNVLAQSLSLSKPYRFGALLPFSVQDGRYWVLPRQGIDRAARELMMFKVKVDYFSYDKYDEASFMRVSEKILREADRLDGLLIAPVLSNAVEKFITRIPTNLPYLFIDSYLPSSRSLCYIGEDSFQSGLLAAKLMNLLVPGNGKTAIIKAMPLDYHIEDRVRGFVSYFSNISNVQLFLYEADARQARTFNKAARKILKEHPDIDGIFSSNARAFEVAAAVSQFPRQRRVHVIGYDLVEENIAGLRRGGIYFLISQRSEMQGYTAVFRLYKAVVLKEETENTVLMPLDIVTRENLIYYQN